MWRISYLVNDLINPEVNEVNRMAAHADFTNKNEWRMSLHGMWGEMPIPGMWELNGLGEPMYAGQNYEELPCVTF